ncbi:hypothetical protein [Natrinema salaciae]|uniref:Uncharacterized protein n=1 Tax=Natrinema salaciae TaxID=1186196 RepID=A0A1H9JBU8_9EURY|nr:hypothetical protein [Natrinema salaciae]SEQ84292.1 hypothetical protein SAMN04489841_2499 [Natrinema salaciae]
MNRPRSRRTLLASVATTAAVATGGFEYSSNGSGDSALESGTVPADRYECRDVDRPEPDVPTDEDALEPREYPSRPAETGSGEESTDRPSSLVRGANQFVTEFERAYRQNAFLERYGSVAQTFELRRTDARRAAIGSAGNPDAVLVAIIYNVTTETQYATTGARDEWDVRVTYYVDENVVLRARYGGIADEPVFDPDPRTQGVLVACFE